MSAASRTLPPSALGIADTVPATGPLTPSPTDPLATPPTGSLAPPATGSLAAPTTGSLAPPASESLDDILARSDAAAATGTAADNIFETPADLLDDDLDLSDDDDDDLSTLPLDEDGETLEDILPLSGTADKVDTPEPLLSSQCTELLNRLGVSADVVQNLCSQDLYDKVKDVKDSFASTMNVYTQKIADKTADLNILHNALLDPNLQVKDIDTIQAGITNVSAERDAITNDYTSLKTLQEKMSEMTDSIFKLRTDLLRSLQTLNEKIEQGDSLTPTGMTQETVSVLQKSKPTEADRLLAASRDSGAPVVAGVVSVTTVSPDVDQTASEVMEAVSESVEAGKTGKQKKTATKKSYGAGHNNSIGDGLKVDDILTELSLDLDLGDTTDEENDFDEVDVM